MGFVLGSLGNFKFVFLVVIVCVLILKLTLKKAAPNEAIIITGLFKHPRILVGQVGFRIPFIERCDVLELGQSTVIVQTEEYIPTKDYINVKVDAVVQIAVDSSKDVIENAMRNFLNVSKEDIMKTAVNTLEGNLREIIGTLDLREICQNKTQFSTEVQEKASVDMKNLGLRILAFNVKTVKDKEDLINNLGIENTEKIRKDALITKAIAKKEVEIADAQAKNEANIATTKSEIEIAERNNQVAIRRAELKVVQDTNDAVAAAAYKIQEETSRKEIMTREQEAEIARREKEIELQAREAEVAEKRLEAEVKKTAEAEKFAEQQKADAELYRRRAEADAERYEREQNAEALRIEGEAEANAIRAKGIAEAEAIDKKAVAMQKYGEAAIIEMLVGVMPDMAKAIAEPLSAIDKVSIIGSGSKGISDLSGNVPVVLANVIESVKEATGFDLQEVMKASTYDAKVNKRVELSGSLEGVQRSVESDVLDEVQSVESEE